MHAPSCPPQVLLAPVYIVFAPGVCFCRWWIGWSTGSYFSHRVTVAGAVTHGKGACHLGSFPNDRLLPWEAPDLLLLLVNHHYERYFCDITWQDTGITLIVVYVCGGAAFGLLSKLGFIKMILTCTDTRWHWSMGFAKWVWADGSCNYQRATSDIARERCTTPMSLGCFVGVARIWAPQKRKMIPSLKLPPHVFDIQWCDCWVLVPSTKEQWCMYPAKFHKFVYAHTHYI